LRFGFGAANAPAQALNMSFVALVIAVVDWCLASAAILPRAELATELAPLSHMLMNGFFFNQGLDMAISSDGPIPRLDRLSRKIVIEPISNVAVQVEGDHLRPRFRDRTQPG
jgi:hypothetical protein